MDPILVKALREFMAKQKQLSQAGIPVEPAHIEEFFRVKTQGKYGMQDAQKLLAGVNTGVGPRNVLRSVVQGVTADFGDEILGALPEAIGGGEGAKEEMRLRGDQFREQHPFVDAAAGMAGGMATGLATGGVGAASAGRAALRGAMYGAAAGGIDGLGRGEGSLTDRAPGALVPMAVGGAVGGVLTGAGAALKERLSPALRASRRMEHAVEESGGTDEMIGRAHDMDAAGRGSEVMAGDLSDRLRLEADFAANNSDDVLAQLAREVKSRHVNASDRLLRDTRTVLGETPNAVARGRALKATTRAFGQSAYDALREANPSIPLTPETGAVLKQPVVKVAMQKAVENGLIGKVPDNGRPSFSHLHDVKRALDGMASAAFKKGDGNLGSRLAEARDAIEKELIEKAPGYTEINAKYASLKGNERALDAGRKAWNAEDIDGLSDSMLSMSDVAREQFRYGMAAKLVAKLRNVRTNRNAAQELMDGSLAMQEKLQVIFGTKENFDRYMARVASEAELAKMKGPISGSATARRLQSAGFDPMELGISAANGGIPTSAAGIVAKLFGMAKAPIDRATARAVGPMVMTKGAKNIEDFLLSLHTPQPVLSRVAGQGVPVGAAHALSGLLK